MLISVQSDTYTFSKALPDEKRGAYWVKDNEDNKLVFVEAIKKGWLVTPAENVSIVATKTIKEALLPFDDATILPLKTATQSWTIVFRPSTNGDKTTHIYGFPNEMQVSIGRDANNILRYPNKFVSGHHATITLRNGHFSIIDHNSANGVFLNARRIPQNQNTSLRIGDCITILGLHITIGANFISLNNPEDSIKVANNSGLFKFTPKKVKLESRQNIKKTPFFYPALRLVRSVEKKEIVVDAPPAQNVEDDTPIAMRIGPSLVMGMASVLSAAMSISFMVNSTTGGGLARAIPMIGMAVAMLAGSVLWPILNRRFEHKKNEKMETIRRAAYSQYLGKVRSDLQKDANVQLEILEENRLSPQTCLAIARLQDPQFMARLPLHKDYLEFRIGRGQVPMATKLRFPEHTFEIREDELKNAVDALAQEPQILNNAPLGHSFIENPVIGLVGSQNFTNGFLRSILIETCALHSYEDVKVAVLADEETSHALSFAKHLPHTFTSAKTTRFFAASIEEANVLGMALSKVLEARQEHEKFDAREAKPYFILVCPSKAVYEKVQIIKDVLATKHNIGFTVITAAEYIHELPSQCKIVLGEDASTGNAYLLNRDDPTGAKKAFVPDPMPTVAEATQFALNVGKARIDVEDAAEQLPDSLTFLQLFKTHSIDHLNISDRWRENNASDTLAAPVGVDASGDPFVLNLHEDFHGPHGLIAGTTGSGKSEFIITYVLSMALNYSPDEVAFVLIDYKGGGLAKAFDNERFRLPHVAGTITNLDGSAISRSLASIQSELKRRQKLFNDAREIIGGDNVDIYKYLDLYRQGKVSEPCPHLILIADEFAELKQQEPEFMDELISASRIGRSLGVHLILATQKPSGVVNDQIWSNSRFKVALKVADAGDSKEIIRRPDAAEIVQPGRFYLLVGYNEYFDKGQSGYSGATYNPSEEPSEQTAGVTYISNTGRALLTKTPDKKASTAKKKPQIVAVSEYIVQTGKEYSKQARLLWMPPIPSYITLEQIERDFKKTKSIKIKSDSYTLDPILGLYDDPSHQAQHVLTLPLTQEGNAIVYGSVDAGAEQVIRTMLYSLIKTHSPKTLNAYILDFGSQSLAAFAEAPQVGDVIMLGEDEKVKRFFGFMSDIVAKRRKLFASYGGSFQRYCEKAEGCPNVFVVINGISAFLDTYADYEEELISFVREATQVGMRIVIVGETPNSVRMRLKNHFRQILACDLPDSGDNVMLFGALHGLASPHGFGRGLTKINDDIYEFQAAHICNEDESEFDAVIAASKQMLVKLSDKSLRAPAIPLPPSRVSADMLSQMHLDDFQFAFGISDDSLTPAVFDFGETPMARCVFLRQKVGARFAEACVEAAVSQGNFQVGLLDMAALFAEEPQKCAFATRKPEYAVSFLSSLATKNRNEKYLVVITGIVGFLKQCSSDVAKGVKEFLHDLKIRGSVSVLLVDAAGDAGYTYEDWFKAHLSNRDGLWVGPGIEGQNAINTSYTRGIRPDAKMSERLGYFVEGGVVRLVHLVSKNKQAVKKQGNRQKEKK